MMTTSLLKIDLVQNIPGIDCASSLPVSYLLPFLMNTNTSDYLERLACREDGWHAAAIATAVTIFDF